MEAGALWRCGCLTAAPAIAELRLGSSGECSGRRCQIVQFTRALWARCKAPKFHVMYKTIFFWAPCKAPKRIFVLLRLS